MAKQKMTAKERREQEQAKKKAAIQDTALRRQRELEEKEAAEKALEEQRLRDERQKQIAEITSELSSSEDFDNSAHFSRAKAAGLKSTLVINPRELVMTSFGRGNDAVLEKRVTDNVVADISESASLQVRPETYSFSVSGRVVQDATADDPLRSKTRAPGLDMIRCRPALEKLYFGKEYEDNIHIQIAYKILDIEKIMTVHMNNIVFELNNMLRIEDDEYHDIIGFLGLGKSYLSFTNPVKDSDKALLAFFQQLTSQPQLAYFGPLMAPPARGKDKNAYEADMEAFRERCYYYFAVLGMLRQATAHGDDSNRAMLYALDRPGYGGKGGCVLQAKVELDRLYSEQVRALNLNFLSHANTDLNILFRLYEPRIEADKTALAGSYYQFMVLKSSKNLGFSVKHLRETLTAYQKDAAWLASDDYASFRQKLYHAADYTIYDYYQKNPQLAAELIEALRAATSEAQKEAIYRTEAKCLWRSISPIINGKLQPLMTGDAFPTFPALKLDESALSSVFLSEEAHYFSEAVYLMTLFLDGKEINDLLTQLIHTFESIGSFVSVLEALGLDASFKKEYAIFTECDTISKELRAINSFARMSTEVPTGKKVMFREAAQLLGFAESDEELDSYLESILDRKAKDADQMKNFRNFIINNVLKSDRFLYLVRYGNPKKLRRLAESKAVLAFVLGPETKLNTGIPDAQILRYYNSFTGEDGEYRPEMRSYLVDRLCGLSFRDFASVPGGNNLSQEQKTEQERKKGLVRLYLTALYLLEKNLIYVNSRYYLAFHSAERDALLYDRVKYSRPKEDWMAFARDFVEENFTNPRQRSYLQQNFTNADSWSLQAFRNCAEHLNAVRNADSYIGDISGFSSYFELYHYLVQRSLLAQFERDCRTESTKYPGTMIMDAARAEGKLLQYFELLKKYRSYCKDFVKALNVPFAYNLARYKNLSVNELFDRNHYLPNSEAAKAEK